ncbi:MAG: HPr kinase/phosphorylase [Deltaproteobacteria bacterium RIFCSPLOWO2_02_FULL_44_10]|nr:MAG: HPr kinase/phosphorylase [Deltaproteobacteria bacterium RIFCSPHIGHO2_02_FULL_44_16]OGQ47037.1 MAG: HPr kinase/phosphorylase [Deltaproteobacteria bacterium RIFCSPLOWO2_02_FULL_44_10]
MFSIPVISLLKDSKHKLYLKLLAGKSGLGKRITIPHIQKPGLALFGETSNLHSGRIQVLGKPEMQYLQSLAQKKLKDISQKITSRDLACIVITCENEPPKPLVEMCHKNDIPLLSTKLLTSTFVNRVSKFLDESLSATTTIHGVLLDIFGVGTLLIGKSGVGKSECALDLILRGHRLVADDIINIKKKPPSTLFGVGSDIIKYHMEIRGLGIISIKELFGISAVRDRKLIEMVVELTEWDPEAEYDRLGIEEQRYTLLDVNLPLIQIPVRPGRNMSAIIEVAVRNHLLKLGGYHSAREFQEKLSREIIATGDETERTRRILELLE